MGVCAGEEDIEGEGEETEDEEEDKNNGDYDADEEDENNFGRKLASKLPHRSRQVHVSM